MDWLEILAIVLGILSILFGAKWKQAKGLIKEIAEALTVTSNAITDNNITSDERKNIVKEWGDVILAAKNLIKK